MRCVSRCFISEQGKRVTYKPKGKESWGEKRKKIKVFRETFLYLRREARTARGLA